MKKFNQKFKLLIFSLWVLGSTVVNAQVWVDSASVAVSDGVAQYDRTGRGVVTTTAPTVGFDVSDIVVLPGEVAGAIKDLSSLFGDKDEIVANCVIPAQNVNVFECPDVSDNSCTRPLTHQSWRTVGAGSDGALRFRRSYSWGYSLYKRGSDYKFYQAWTSPTQNLDGPGDFDDPLVITPVIMTAKTIEVTLSKLKGYRIRYNGTPILTNEWVEGELDAMQGLYGTATNVIQAQVASHPRILKPKYELEFLTSCGRGCTRSIGKVVTTMSDAGGPSQPRISEKEGIRPLKGYGYLKERLGISAIKHVQAAGKYQPLVTMSVENVWLQPEGGNYTTFFNGSEKVDQIILKWKGISKSNSSYWDEITSMEVSNAAATTPSTTPFKHNLTCSFN